MGRKCWRILSTPHHKNSTIAHSHLTLNGASSSTVNYLQRWTQHVFCHKLCFSPSRNVSWVAGVYLNDTCDVKAMLLLLAVKRNLQKLLMVGLLSSFPPVTGHCQYIPLQRKHAQKCSPGIWWLRLGCCRTKTILKSGGNLKCLRDQCTSGFCSSVVFQSICKSQLSIPPLSFWSLPCFCHWLMGLFFWSLFTDL